MARLMLRTRSRPQAHQRGYVALITLALAVGVACGLDTTIPNLSEVLWSPAKTGVYLGSPSIVRTSTGALLASNDYFGAGEAGKPRLGTIHRSEDNGTTWVYSSTADQQYWSTLFVRGSDVYTFGVSGDNSGGTTADVVIQRSTDDGRTWAERTTILSASHGYSTGPTPVVVSGGRIWRAFEYNAGSWGSGYHALLVSAPEDSDLMNASNWVQTGGLPFPSNQVPANWSLPHILTNYGWLEGNAVSGPSGVMYNVLRVNSVPTANKAALVRVTAFDKPPVFDRWLDFPGGMSKFSIRYDPATKLWLTLSNTVDDASIWPQPGCLFTKRMHESAVANKSCCSPTGLVTCEDCVWCRAVSRNVLTLNTSPDLVHWTVQSTVLQDDTGFQPWMSEIMTGFQYVDFELDGPGGENLIALVRAGYRGSESGHNSNRILFHLVPQWRKLLRG